jgi:hypothetical protein
MLGHVAVRVITWFWGYSVRQHIYKQNVFRISFVVESFITIHNMNIMLGHTIKNT